MREFRDDLGRPWVVALTVNAVMRVRDNVTIDIDGQRVPFRIDDASIIGVTLQILRSQFATIAETLYAVLSKQIEEKKLTKEEFFDGLRGDALDAGARALEAELIDFFPQRLRKPISLLAAKVDEMQQVAVERAEANIQAATPDDLLSPSGMRSGRQQEFSEFTQESGHSDNSLQHAMPA